MWRRQAVNEGLWQAGMDKALENIWAKTAKSGAVQWHPLILPMLDVAASSDIILMVDNG
jgi:hypothetical protein